jgi:hypothetical protein
MISIKADESSWNKVSCYTWDRRQNGDVSTESQQLRNLCSCCRWLTMAPRLIATLTLPLDTEFGQGLLETVSWRVFLPECSWLLRWQFSWSWTWEPIVLTGSDIVQIGRQESTFRKNLQHPSLRQKNPTTRRHKPADPDLNIHRCEGHRSHIHFLLLVRGPLSLHERITWLNEGQSFFRSW